MMRIRHHSWASVPLSTRAPVLALGSAACVFALVGCDPLQPPPPLQSDSSAASAPRLIVSPDPIALGILAPGQSARAEVMLRNETAEAVSVERVETSCACIRVSPTSIEVGAGESAVLTIAFDPTDEPGFRGGLSVDVVGKEVSGRVALRSRVNLEVRRASASKAGGSSSDATVGNLAVNPMIEVVGTGGDHDGDL